MSDQNRTERRAFLATLAATGVGLAGCSSLSGDGSDAATGSPTSSATPTATSSTTPESTATEQSDQSQSTESTDLGSHEPMQPKAATFEDLSYWTSHAGVTLEGDSETVYQGSQSARIEGRSGTIQRSFPVPIDLSNRDISLAMKIDGPVPNNFGIYLYDTGGNATHLIQGYHDKHPDGWIRINPSIDSAGADMSSITKMLITLGGGGENKKYWVDDIRFHEKTSDKAQVMFTFDYITRSIYEVAFSEMEKRGITGAVSVPGDRVGNADRLTVEELKELKNAGWEITSMSNNFEPLYGQSERIQRQRLERNISLLDQFGLGKPTTLMYPKGFCDATTVKLAEEYHDLGFLTFNDSERGTSQSALMGPTFVNRSQPSTVEALKNQVEPAKAYNGLYVVHQNQIGPNADNNRAVFTEMLDYVKEQQKQGNVEIVTPSDVVL
ncbi:polysaccharide deacetylase family protein [Halorarius litoreus]|uniref:polysaccharide deacetylase family protein n=1 Tax=Halorarius litoreus TaxID=2962676 RepID=UPI0020CBAEED|nr:polysaccharide deacetylase family protein [Halorarius litoreus]